MHRLLKLCGLALVIAAMLLSACQQATQAPEPTTAEQPVATVEPTTAPVVEATTAPVVEATQPPAPEKVELVFWDSWEESGSSAAFDQIIKNFEAKNPNITIKREFQNFEDMKTLLKTALASGTGPDMASYGVGGGFMGPLADAGLLLPVDKYAEQYKWKDRMYPWIWEQSTFGGKLYGIGHELEMIGVYYNQSIFKELGVTPPTTYEEFISICDKAKAAGYIPIAFANKPGWPAFHMFSMFANNIAGKDFLEKAIFGDQSWDDPLIVQSIQMPFVDMNKAGYFIPSPNSLEYEEGNDLFYTGKTAMHMTGMWLLSDILSKAQGFEAGFFAFPSVEGKPALPPGGMGSGIMISNTTKYPDEAAAFMDYMFSEEAAKIWYEVGKVIPPNDVDTSSYEMEPLFRFFVDTIHAASTGEGAGLGYNIDVLTPPEFNTAMKDGFQAVLEGALTPEDQAKALQAAKEAAAK
jgi:raffinose/stachyose/melibiose transport system substrate-binding protein